MKETTKDRIALVLTFQTGLPVEACTDMVDEVINQITQLEQGKSYYQSIEQIVVDYLQLPASWAVLFLD